MINAEVETKEQEEIAEDEMDEQNDTTKKQIKSALCFCSSSKHKCIVCKKIVCNFCSEPENEENDLQRVCKDCNGMEAKGLAQVPLPEKQTRFLLQPIQKLKYIIRVSYLKFKVSTISNLFFRFFTLIFAKIVTCILLSYD